MINTSQVFASWHFVNMCCIFLVIIQQLYHILSDIVGGYLICGPKAVLAASYVLGNYLAAAYVICNAADAIAEEVRNHHCSMVIHNGTGHSAD